MEYCKKERESGIELLKIIAIFLIVVSHVVQTLDSANYFFDLNLNGYIDLKNVTSNFQQFIVTSMRYFGSLGNLIFVICSSWFFVEKKGKFTRKIVNVIVDSLSISLLLLLVFILCKVPITNFDIISSFRPIHYVSNWYINVYILFLLSMPLLNLIVSKTSKKQLLKINIVSVTLYFIIYFLVNSYFYSDVFLFFTIFFVVAYIKKYCSNMVCNIKLNKVLLLLGFLSIFIFLFTLNYLGLKNPNSNINLQYWNKNNNPFLLLISLSLFVIFKNKKFKSSGVNSISSLSLYVYLIHESILIKKYTRVYIWSYIYNQFSYKFIILEVFVYSILLMIFSLIASFIYKYIIKKYIDILLDKIYNSGIIRRLYKKIEGKIYFLDNKK